MQHDLKGTNWRHKDGEIYTVLAIRKDNFIGQMNLIYYTPRDMEKVVGLKKEGKCPIFCRTEEHFRSSFQRIKNA